MNSRGINAVDTNSNGSTFGQLLGMWLGNRLQNIQTDELNKKASDIQKAYVVTDEAKNNFLKLNPDLDNGIKNGEISDDFISQNGGANTQNYLNARKVYQGLIQSKKDYANATDDAGRDLAHNNAENLRRLGFDLGITKTNGDYNIDDYSRMSKDINTRIAQRIADDKFNDYYQSNFKKVAGYNLPTPFTGFSSARNFSLNY